ncbi:hypothetical protein GLOIN_2v1783209 [Rhizophagus irregularis DAOM 181602=DAOM 197198]|nr:hypothetical protein GLOIN_2v1783209 [Rhizophagus irregularis DAOM 181602=DAOM 197198]
MIDMKKEIIYQYYTSDYTILIRVILTLYWIFDSLRKNNTQLQYREDDLEHDTRKAETLMKRRVRGLAK